MKKVNILALLLLTLACGCKNTPNSHNDTATTTTQPSTSSLPENLSVKWRIDNKMIDDSDPSCDLYVNVNGKDILVEKAMTINLEEMKPPFDTIDRIPKDALLACRGFWAGWDCRMYVRKDGDKLVVFEGAHPEGSDIEEGSEYEGISYRALKTISAADLK